MIVLKTERIKSIILFLLVTMSFVLTTRIWFHISIEGLFPMSSVSRSKQAEFAYDQENLLKPSRLVVHTGNNLTLLFNNNKDKVYYSGVLNGAKDIVRDWFNNYQDYTMETVDIAKLDEIRAGKAVELIFRDPLEVDTLRALLQIEKNPWNDIKSFKSIIISPYENRIYIIDEYKRKIYQFSTLQMTGVLRGVITDVEKQNDIAYKFLNEYNTKDNPESYSNYAVVPVEITTMPVLRVKKEVTVEPKITPYIDEFFDEDSTDISVIKDLQGTVTYTDREEETVKINMDGMLEYYKYNVSAGDIRSTSVSEALSITSEYINSHSNYDLGFTYDFYLSGVEDEERGGRTSYLIRYDYKYNGIPIVTASSESESAIEIETLGNEVKRYKRNVRKVLAVERTVNIKKFYEILDIIWGRLNDSLYEEKLESVVRVNDMYLAYIERNDALIPIWVVNIRVRGTDDKEDDVIYILDAEKGMIWDNS